MPAPKEPAPKERAPLPKPRGSGTIPPPATGPRPFPPRTASQVAAPRPASTTSPPPTQSGPLPGVPSVPRSATPTAPPPSGPVPQSIHTQPTTPAPFGQPEPSIPHAAPQPVGTQPSNPYGAPQSIEVQPTHPQSAPTFVTSAPIPAPAQKSFLHVDSPHPHDPHLADPAWAMRSVGPGDSLEEVPGSAFVKFLKISSKRAFRLRIEPGEVLASERRSLHAASPPIADPNLQAFLAWRRSVLFLVACALVPLALVGAIDAFTGSMAGPIRFLKAVPVIAEMIFAYVCWSQLKEWTNWRAQRRKLMWAWLLFMLAPFVVFLYPLRSVFAESTIAIRDNYAALGVTGAYNKVAPFMFAMLAMLQLAPKAISLMPGLIRASLVIKMLFPGSTAPGWLIVLTAPIYALIAYVVLIIPYQYTGSGWFIAGVIGVIAGQVILARAGFSLAHPQTEDEALRQIRRVRTYYMTVMVVSGLLIVVALGSLVSQLHLSWTNVALAVLKFEANVLILTMIGADLVVTNLDRARAHTVGKDHVEEHAEAKIAAFVSLDAPHVPPPPGPAA